MEHVRSYLASLATGSIVLRIAQQLIIGVFLFLKLE